MWLWRSMIPSSCLFKMTNVFSDKVFLFRMSDSSQPRKTFAEKNRTYKMNNPAYPKYLISIGIIIWNEKKDFRTLSRGDHNHWCVWKEINWPKSTLCFQHWCSTCYIKDRFLICCYFICHRHQKSSHQDRQLHQPKQRASSYFSGSRMASFRSSTTICSNISPSGSTSSHLVTI